MKNFLNYIKNKTILIVGGAPIKIRSKKWFDSFDIIVRINNYKKITNSRTDVFFSHFGYSITKTKEELIKDGVKFCINKCPNSNMNKLLRGKKILNKDYRWIYNFRKNWWFCPIISLSEDELLNQVNLLNGYMPTVGFSAILYFLKFNNKSLSIIGFDCFESGLHNLNEKWDKSGNHKPELEKENLLKLEKTNKLIWYK